MHIYAFMFKSLHCILLCTHCLYARVLSPFSYTLIGSLSVDPEFARPDWMLYSVAQVFMRSYICTRWITVWDRVDLKMEDRQEDLGILVLDLCVKIHL